MQGHQIKSSFLTRDRKLFLELSQSEVDYWVPRMFDRLRPQMAALNPALLNAGEPENLVLLLDLTMDQVREVAGEMADSLLTAARMRKIRPLLNAYCDELLASGRERDAAFIQFGLIRFDAFQRPGQNPLLVEICAQALYQQVDQMYTIGRTAPQCQ